MIRIVHLDIPSPKINLKVADVSWLRDTWNYPKYYWNSWYFRCVSNFGEEEEREREEVLCSTVVLQHTVLLKFKGTLFTGQSHGTLSCNPLPPDVQWCTCPLNSKGSLFSMGAEAASSRGAHVFSPPACFCCLGRGREASIMCVCFFKGCDYIRWRNSYTLKMCPKPFPKTETTPSPEISA